MATELISILIATYNRSHTLSELLSRLTSLFEQELAQGTTEILIFDDASTDDTARICARYKAYIQYMATPQNVGYIEARRRLITAAQGTYLVSLDDDSCFLDNNALEQIRVAFSAYPTCGGIAANIASPPSPGGQLPVETSPMAVANFVGCGHVLRAEFVQRVGGYPDFLTGYGAEETVLSLRLLDAGYQVIFLPTLRVYHAHDPTQRPLVKQRAQSFLNELGIVAYAYPLWLILPTMIRKTVSRIIFEAKQQTLLGVSNLAVRQLPQAIRPALQQRRSVRIQTLRQFFALRQVFMRQSQQWQMNGGKRDIWPETKTMFVDSQLMSK